MTHEQDAGTHPDDRTFFAPDALPPIREAVSDLSWLLGRGYAIDGALKLTGDRYQLHARQRLAARRCACPDDLRIARARRRCPLDAIAGEPLWIDGYNLLITLATALRGGLVMVGRDGAIRDIASSHRLVLRTDEMLGPIAALLALHPPSEVCWVLDRPISNSDRVGQMIAAFGAERGLPWRYRLEPNADQFLIDLGLPVVSSDALILDGAPRWVDLLSPLVAGLPEAWLISL